MIAKPQFAPAESRFVYRSAFAVAAEALKQKYDVVLVATFPSEEMRREAISKLGNLCDAWLMVWAWCDPELAYQRYSQRNPMVRREDFMKLSRTFEPPRDALVIDSRATSPEEAASKMLAALGGRVS